LRRQVGSDFVAALLDQDAFEFGFQFFKGNSWHVFSNQFVA